jgi:hypothetical protein
MTTPADLTAFTTEDLDEAGNPLTQLAQDWSLPCERSMASASTESKAAPGRCARSPYHLGDNAFYADAVGELTAQREP